MTLLNKWLIAGFSLIAFIAVIHFYGNSRYEQGKADERLAQAVAIQAAKDESDAQIAFVRKQYNDLKAYIAEAPNDASCVQLIGSVVDRMPSPSGDR